MHEIERSISTFSHHGDLENVVERVKELKAVKGALSSAIAEGGNINDEELRLDWSATDFLKLEKLKNMIAPFDDLWTIAEAFSISYESWKTDNIYVLDGEKVADSVESLQKRASKVLKILLREAPQAAKCAQQILGKLGAFKENLPLVIGFSSKGMRERHWAMVGDLVGFAVQPEEEICLDRLLELEVAQHKQVIKTIAETASKEASIENALITMKQDWESISYTLKSYKDTGTHILISASVDEIQALLDDYIVKTMTMKSSSFAKHHLPSIEKWEAYLLGVQDLIDSWLHVQTSWQYLEPVFTSADILKQMPKEGEMFRRVDTKWRNIMSTIQSESRCLEVDVGLKDEFENAMQKLDEISKGLAAYLETKRLYFSRFFFLSNDELLEILSETKDPTRVQPHLKKCFEGISALNFSSDGLITHMISKEGEVVQLNNAVNPESGAVERWLLQLENTMRESVKIVALQARNAYTTIPRTDWVLDWPGQIVLCVGSIFWTYHVEQAIKSGTLDMYLDHLDEQIVQIVSLVRGKLKRLERATLSAACTVDAHARAVVRNLVEEGVSNISDFSWESQLRSYYSEASADVEIKIMNSVAKYGWEYLGNSSRLVITPLTDRCYRTLMGAINMQYGGAPEGPAGTGKTETVKDLAKNLAKQCVVFNCSDGLDYLAMGKFFKGLASSGAWACFDEFNRIDLEVLSVIAQQILQIQTAVAQRKTRFIFEGTEIKCRHSAATFITMNPGYAGRSELPDNLKALFRPCAMMVPDYSLIAEIILFSKGFANASNLARKIVASFRLCSEQLSQRHYDYGMRAVIAVLQAAGKLRLGGSRKEDEIIMDAIIKVNAPKFLSNDIPLFEGIVSDLFPKVKVDGKQKAYNKTITSMGLQPLDAFNLKINQLRDTVENRHGLMIVGGPLSGKSSCWRVLAKDMKSVDVFLINPKSLGSGRLYGQFDKVSHEWQDGVLAKTFRICSKATDERRKWILFDGPVDAGWIENMNTVLDDNKKLCLSSGEIVAMSNYMSMIFEPMDLEVASPATVSRVGIVYFESPDYFWRACITSWIEAAENVIPRLVVEIIDWICDPLLKFWNNLPARVQISKQHVVITMLQIYDGLIKSTNFDSNDPSQSKPAMAFYESNFIFSLAYALGGNLSTIDRNKLHSYLHTFLVGGFPEYPKQRRLSVGMPENGTIFDYVWQQKDARSVGSWVSWRDLVEPPYLSESTAFSEIVIHTSDVAKYSFLLNLAIQIHKPLLFVGETGTGKTVISKTYLARLDEKKFDVLQVAFSAQTRAAQLQRQVDSRLDRRRKGVYGPSNGRSLVVFIDDFNMPQRQQYGAQPPLEIVRHVIKYCEFYDLKTLALRTIVGVQFVAAMAPPGGGRNEISRRVLRHFQIVWIPESSDSTLLLIYETILNFFCRNQDAPIKGMCQKIVSATIEAFRGAKELLLPTPHKSHYLYNLRDVSRIIQGIGLMRYICDAHTFIRLWSHETCRVLGDRLISCEDRNTFTAKILSNACVNNFGLNLGKDILKTGEDTTWDAMRKVVFGSF